MSPGNKYGRPSPRGPAANSECLQEVLEACAQLPSKAGPAVLRDYVADSARKIFQASLAGILAREGEGYVLGSQGEATRIETALTQEDEATAVSPELVSCARTCAMQAIHQQKVLDFRFSPTKTE